MKNKMHLTCFRGVLERHISSAESGKTLTLNGEDLRCIQRVWFSGLPQNKVEVAARIFARVFTARPRLARMFGIYLDTSTMTIRVVQEKSADGDGEGDGGTENEQIMMEADKCPLKPKPSSTGTTLTTHQPLSRNKDSSFKSPFNKRRQGVGGSQADRGEAGGNGNDSDSPEMVELRKQIEDSLLNNPKFLMHAKAFAGFWDTVVQELSTEVDRPQDLVAIIRSIGRHHSTVPNLSFTAENWLLIKSSILQVVCGSELYQRNPLDKSCVAWTKLLMFMIGEMKDAYLLGVNQRHTKNGGGASAAAVASSNQAVGPGGIHQKDALPGGNGASFPRSSVDDPAISSPPISRPVQQDADSSGSVCGSQEDNESQTRRETTTSSASSSTSTSTSTSSSSTTSSSSSSSSPSSSTCSSGGGVITVVEDAVAVQQQIPSLTAEEEEEKEENWTVHVVKQEEDRKDKMRSTLQLRNNDDNLNRYNNENALEQIFDVIL